MGIWTPESVKALRLRMGLRQDAFGELIGVSRQAVSEWENGKVEVSDFNGAALDRLELDAVAGSHPPGDILDAAVQVSGQNIRRLAEIRGYAQAVLDQLLDAAKRQQIVVDSLAPWADAESQQLAKQLQKATAAAAALRRAVPPIGAPAEPAAPPAKKTASGGK